MLALTGPQAARVAETTGAGALNALGYFQHGEARIGGGVVRGVRLLQRHSIPRARACALFADTGRRRACVVGDAVFRAPGRPASTQPRGGTGPARLDAVFRVALPAYPDRPDGHGETSTIPPAHIECAALTPHRRRTRVTRPRADAQAPTQSCR